MLFNLCVIDRNSLALCLSHYFGDANLEQQDAWEADVSSETSSLWQAPQKLDVCATVQDRPVVLRNVKDMLFVLSGSASFDELAREDGGRAACLCSLARSEHDYVGRSSLFKDSR